MSITAKTAKGKYQPHTRKPVKFLLGTMSKAPFCTELNAKKQKQKNTTISNDSFIQPHSSTFLTVHNILGKYEE